MTPRYLLPLLLILVFPLSAQADQATDPRVETARNVAGQFKKNLKEALTAALPNGAPAAITVCSLKAPAIAASLTKEGIEAGRTTAKTRNPKNAPVEWMKPLLTELEKAPKKEGAYLTRTLADGRLAYVEPIYMQPMCLTCHGDPGTLSPETRKILDEKYPQDKATGYRDGDFRGMFWVTVK